MSKTLQWIGLAAVVAGLLFLACCISYRIGRNKAEIVTETDTLVIVRLDTIREKYPVYIAERVVDSVRIPVYCHDTTYVEVPITQKHYHQDSLYDAWVSGFMPQLDSIDVMQRTEIVEVTNYVQRPVPRWSFGVTAGPSVLWDGKFHAGLGVTAGLQYRF